MDASRAVYVYDLDRLRLHWRLPLALAPITCLAFHPQSTASLVVAQANNTFMVYEVDDLDRQGLAASAPGPGLGDQTATEDMSLTAQGQGLGQGHGLSVWSQLNTNRIPDSLRNLAGNNPPPLVDIYPPLC